MYIHILTHESTPFCYFLNVRIITLRPVKYTRAQVLQCTASTMEFERSISPTLSHKHLPSIHFNSREKYGINALNEGRVQWIYNTYKHVYMYIVDRRLTIQIGSKYIVSYISKCKSENGRESETEIYTWTLNGGDRFEDLNTKLVE